MKFCKYAEKIDEKHIKCKLNGSIRNIMKNPCELNCNHSEFSFWERLKRRFVK